MVGDWRRGAWLKCKMEMLRIVIHFSGEKISAVLKQEKLIMPIHLMLVLVIR
jgi:hypothetical protein